MRLLLVKKKIIKKSRNCSCKEHVIQSEMKLYNQKIEDNSYYRKYFQRRHFLLPSAQDRIACVFTVKKWESNFVYENEDLKKKQLIK